MTNIHIGNLSFNTNDDGLKEAFAEFGNVESARVIMDRATGKSKGFGFVEMTNEEEADNAIKNLNGKMIDGRKVRVSMAIPREERESRGFRQ